MVNLKFLVVACGAVVLAIAAWVFLFPSEEARIKKQFSSLSAQVSKKTDEGILDTALRVRRTEGLFAPKCTVTMSEAFLNGETEGSTLVAQGFQGRMQFASMDLSFSNFRISFPEEGLARCEVVAKLTGIGPGGTKVNESREMLWELRKIEGSWRFEKISEVVVLKK